MDPTPTHGHNSNPQLCKGVLSSPEAAAAQRASCEKHNVTPRPVTLELCLGTFQGIAPSACTNACDGVSRVEPDLCGSVSASTWIPKHQAYKSCKSGYEVSPMSFVLAVLDRSTLHGIC